MAITQFAGGEIITGSHVEVYRWMSIVSGLKLEAKGIKLSRGISCLALVKRELNVKGNRDKILVAAEAHLAKIKAAADQEVA